MPVNHIDEMSDKRYGELSEHFNLFDTVGDGKIDKSHLGTVLRAMGENPTESDVRVFAQGLADERISFEQFLPIFEEVSRKKSQYNVDDFVNGLRNFDREGNGTISVPEMRHLLTNLGERLTDEEVDQLVAPYNSSGSINYEEFVRTVLTQ